LRWCPASHQDDPAAAAAVARDIAYFDQHGCLSPAARVRRIGRRPPLRRAPRTGTRDLAPSLPRGPLDTALAVRVNQWQGACAARAEDFHRGSTYAVAALGEPHFFPSPGARHVAVTPLTPARSLAALWIRTPFISPAPASRARTSRTCMRCYLTSSPCPRRYGAPGAAGLMQDPPLDGHEDPRPPMIDPARG